MRENNEKHKLLFTISKHLDLTSSFMSGHCNGTRQANVILSKYHISIKFVNHLNPTFSMQILNTI